MECFANISNWIFIEQKKKDLQVIHNFFSALTLCRTSEDLVASANTWADLVVLSFRMAGSVEIGLGDNR